MKIMKYLQTNNADIHLTIAGYGSEDLMLQQKINDYQLKNVTFLNRNFSQP